jgi:hypothetical protein
LILSKIVICIRRLDGGIHIHITYTKSSVFSEKRRFGRIEYMPNRSLYLRKEQFGKNKKYTKSCIFLRDDDLEKRILFVFYLSRRAIFISPTIWKELSRACISCRKKIKLSKTSWAEEVTFDKVHAIYQLFIARKFSKKAKKKTFQKKKSPNSHSLEQ